MRKITSIIFTAVLLFNSYLAWLVFDLKKQTDNILGATIPTITALFETSLQSSITSTATTAILVKGTNKEGTSLTGTIGFVIDEGTSDEEFVTCSASGTALTSCTRGISVTQPASSSAALKKSHRRGASIKITNYPQLAILSRILNGTDTIPNILNYDSPPTFTASRSIITKKYADDLAFAGVPNAHGTQKGIVEEATTAEIDAGTAAGSTLARLYVNPASLSLSIYNTRLPTAGQKNALAGSLGTPSSTNLYITGQDVASSSFSANASRSDWIIRSDGDSVPSGLWIDITKLNITASASGDILYRSATAFTRLAIKSGIGEEILVASGGFPIWASASAATTGRIASFTTDVTCNDCTTATTLFTFTLPGGRMGANDRLEIWIDLNAFGGQVDDVTSEARVLFGACTSTHGLSVSSKTQSGYWKVSISAVGSTSSQEVRSTFFTMADDSAETGANKTTYDTFDGTCSVSTASDVTITLDFKWASAATTNILTAESGYAILIK